MIVKKSWEEFIDTGLFHAMNQFLQLFGYSIVIERDNNTKKIVAVFPARVSNRGVASKKKQKNMYVNLGKYMIENSKEIYEESVQEFKE